MPEYDYKADDGSLITRVYTMREDKPGKIMVDGKVYTRVFGTRNIVAKMGYDVKPGGLSKLPISRTAPIRTDGIVNQSGSGRNLVNTHADGMKTDFMGRAIVATRKDRDRVEAFAKQHYAKEATNNATS